MSAAQPMTVPSTRPLTLSAVGRAGARLAFAGALAVGLLTSAPTTHAHAAAASTAAQHRTVSAKAAHRRAVARHRAQVQTRIDRAVRTAAHQKGDPYSYGSAGPNRFDCSGLTYYSFRKAGFGSIPRTSSAQAGWARHVSRGNMHRGDLVFFASGGHVYHVGVFAGWKHGRPLVLHSPYTGARVRTEPIWTNSWFGGAPRG